SYSPDSYPNSVVQAIHEVIEAYHPGEGIPTVKQLKILLSTCFWASLKTEEGQHAKTAIAVVNPEEEFFEGLALHRPLPFSDDVVVKLSPILRTDDAYLGVCFPKRSAPRISYICERPLLTIVTVRSVAPGHIAVYASRALVADL